MSLNQITSEVRRTRIKSFVCLVLCQSSGSGSGVDSFNGRTGAVSPQSGDYSAFYDSLGSAAAAQAASQPLSSVLTQYIAGVNKVYYKSGTSSSVTSTTNETVLKSIVIPGGTIQAEDRIYIAGAWTKPGANGAVVFTIRVHTSAAVGGSIIGQFSSGATIKFTQIERTILVKDTLSSQLVILNTSTNLPSDFATNVTGKTDLSIDWTVDQYITWNLTPASGSDVCTMEHVIVQIFR